MVQTICRFLVYCLFVFCGIPNAFSADTLVISNNKADYTLEAEYIQILEDSTNKLTINDIVSEPYHSQFVNSPVDSKILPSIKNTNATYWVKFTIRTDSDDNQNRYILENLDLHVDNFELYTLSDSGKYKINQAGYALPFNTRIYPHKNFVFDIPVDSQPKTFYIKVSSSNHNVLLFKIRSAPFFTLYSTSEYYLLGIFYGILLIMAVYNLLMYFSMRESLYLYFIVYILCGMIITLTEDGTGFQYLWPEHPEWNHLISSVSPLLLVLSFTFYSKRFLLLKTTLPAINRIFNYILAGYTAFYFIDLFTFNLSKSFPIHFIPFVLIYFAAIRCLRKGYRPARFYVIGYTFMFISIILFTLRFLGVHISDSIITVYSFNIGLVFETVLMSFALADRIKIMKNEKEEAQKKIISQLQENERLKDKLNKELEIKVQERTQEISRKNQELEYANSLLKEQAEEIARINQLLEVDNKQLKTNVKELTKARIFLKDVDFAEFSKIFPDKEACLSYLVELKWSKGYSCKKCNNTKWCKGKDEFSRRCTKCRYDESATAYTIFHKLKFPITKAFYMLFLIYANKEKITSFELSQIVSLRQSTCWNFNRKIQAAVANNKKKNNSDSEVDGWAQLIIDPENE